MDVVPVIVGTGAALTWIFLIVGMDVVHPFRSLYLTLMVCAPVEFQITVIRLVLDNPTIVPPEEMVQVYPVMPLSVTYDTWLPVQLDDGPEMVGTEIDCTVTAFVEGRVAVHPLRSV